MKEKKTSVVAALFNELFLDMQQTHSKGNELVQVMHALHQATTSPGIHTFNPKNNVDVELSQIEAALQQQCATYNKLNEPISYLIDELICNIQQHSEATIGCLYIDYNKKTNCIEVVVADNGISIYGSYISAQKYLAQIADSDAQAIRLAKDGYSTKNLPNAENRGYGISSNLKMIVNGLGGEFAIYSGNALYIASPDSTKLLELPNELDMEGTMFVALIPTDVPEDYKFYDYIS